LLLKGKASLVKNQAFLLVGTRTWFSSVEDLRSLTAVSFLVLLVVPFVVLLVYVSEGMAQLFHRWRGACGLLAMIGRSRISFLVACSLASTTAAQVGSSQRKENARVLGLVELYGATSSIMYGEEDEYAASVLFEFLKPHLKGIKTVPAKENKPRSDDLVIYVGSFRSNPASKAVFKSLGYSLNWDHLTEGSFLLKTFRKKGKTVVFAAGKDRLGTLYAAFDLKNYYLRVELGRVLLNELNLVERAHLKYRWFRNWDNRTNWDLTDSDNHFTTEFATALRTSPYENSPDAHLRDLKKTIDFMSEHRLNGLVLWGFLRDSHGGVAAAQELCRYAQERGVRILPGVGLGGYGGFFYDGNHQFNLQSWTKAHPELRAMDEKGNFRDNAICPEKPENRRWFREGLEWLYQNFRIGGVSLEAGEFFVCYSEDCKQARQAMGGGDPDYLKDMARIVSFVAQEARKLDPNTWVSYFTYLGFDFDSLRNPPGAPSSKQSAPPFPPEFVQRIPEYAICQWDLTPMLQSGVWPSPFKASAKSSVGFLRWSNVPTKSQRELYMKRLEEVTHHTISSNLEGLGMFGELSPENPNVELNYLMFGEFAYNPATDLGDFFRFKISRLYGGEEPARKVMKVLDLVEGEKGLVEANVPQAVQLARQGLEESERSGKERWSRLVNYLEGLERD
jgi:hypothetical protein